MMTRYAIMQSGFTGVGHDWREMSCELALRVKPFHESKRKIQMSPNGVPIYSIVSEEMVMLKISEFVRVLLASTLFSLGVMSGFAMAESAPAKKIVLSESQPVSSISVTLTDGALKVERDTKKDYDFDELAATVREQFKAKSLLVESTDENGLTLEIRVKDFGRKFNLRGYAYFIDADLVLRDAEGKVVGQSEASGYFSPPGGLIGAAIYSWVKPLYGDFALEAMYVVTGKRPTKSIVDM